jgi:hypothetical protein
MFLFEYFDEFLSFCYILISQSLDTGIDHRLFDERECIPHMLGAYLTIHHILFEESESIAESATSRFCYDAECFILSFESLFFTDVFESMDDILETDFAKVESECS